MCRTAWCSWRTCMTIDLELASSLMCYTSLLALYSRTSIIRPSIIRNLDYPAWQFSCYQIRKWACPSNAHACCSCYHGDCLLMFCACADNHVALLFINKVGGSRRGLSIRLSGVFTYPACFWNQGVRIIEVLLYLLVLDCLDL